MKYIPLIFAVLSILIISCNDMKKGQEKAKKFPTAADAASAAKQDMIEASEKVNFGVDKEKLRTSSTALPISSYDVIWDALLKTDSSKTLESIIGLKKEVVVPLVNGKEVVAVVLIEHKNQGYAISGLGEKQISSELNTIIKADTSVAQAQIKIYNVPNLHAIIYAVEKGNTTAYYSSYNGNSLRQPIEAKALLTKLVSDANDFQKKYGEELKKGNLVR